MNAVALMNQVKSKFMSVQYKYYKILLFILIHFLLPSNNHPIFLIHGFMGWGRDELANYYYWGGSQDLQKILQDEGFEVHTLSVGPISSNWERAIEVYSQIKGGCIDYGEEHSKKYNIIQEPKGKCYPGLYPEWDETHPIHIIGHSQGGLTARMLEHLLSLSIENEKSDLLSQTHTNHIISVTTFSTPHNGTSLSFIMNNKFPSLQKISAYAGVLNNIFLKNYYNFDLDHWNLKKNKAETYSQFIQRINNSNIKSTKNSASWDLSIDGAKQFNNIYTSNKNTYYFSFSTSSSIPQKNSTEHRPSKTMNYYLKPTCKMIGKSSLMDSLWYENDGIVNTVSMNGPHDETIIQYNEIPITGIWQHMGILEYDHHQILLRRNNYDSDKLINLYINHCKLLYEL